MNLQEICLLYDFNMLNYQKKPWKGTYGINTYMLLAANIDYIEGRLGRIT